MYHQLYFLPPLSCFHAHLSALSHLCMHTHTHIYISWYNLIKLVDIYIYVHSLCSPLLLPPPPPPTNPTTPTHKHTHTHKIYTQITAFNTHVQKHIMHICSHPLTPLSPTHTHARTHAHMPAHTRAHTHTTPIKPPPPPQQHTHTHTHTHTHNQYLVDFHRISFSVYRITIGLAIYGALVESHYVLQNKMKFANIKATAAKCTH